jgi:diguanylate cyclase (GGDEF)-like protein
MNAPSRHRVLCVDDEPQILEGLALHLRRRHEVVTATSGAAALEVLEQDKTIAVIISDMRMPGMDGATFLARARALVPTARRILLTGQTDMAAAIAAINQGQIFRFLTKPCPPPELLVAVDAALENRRDDSLERSAIRRGIEARLVGLDPLTALASRDGLLQALTAAASADDPDAAAFLTVYFLDVEGFKDLNDACDPAAGDHALQAFAGRLQAQFPAALCLARWSTDQFVAVTPRGDADGQSLHTSGAALAAALGEPIQLEDGIVEPRISVGTARWPFDSAVPRTVINYAELAMREAKKSGGSTACVFRHEWREKLEYRRTLLGALREAIDRNQLHLHYQPIVDVGRNAVYALECLVRWEHPSLGNVPPATFIPIAEENGMVERLGAWILQHACVEARQLIGPHCARLAVNISVLQLLQENFLSQLDVSLKEASMDPRTLELEITESVFANDVDRVLVVLQELRSRGMQIAIDDFGTGYSSLAYVNQFPINVLKVDRSFVRTFSTGGDTIISAALTIARRRGMDVVIEGVETALMLQQVRQLGASLIQGYLFARPMSVNATAEWLRRFSRKLP